MEDARTGTRFEDYVIGERTGPLRFTLEPAFVKEYIAAAGVDASLYRVDNRDAAPPQVLTLFLMGTLHQRYVPLPGTMMVELVLELHAPIWRDESTIIVSEGKILAKESRHGRHYVTWRAEYRRAGGDRLANITNIFMVPS